LLLSNKKRQHKTDKIKESFITTKLKHSTNTIKNNNLILNLLNQINKIYIVLLMEKRHQFHNLAELIILNNIKF